MAFSRTYATGNDGTLNFSTTVEQTGLNWSPRSFARVVIDYATPYYTWDIQLVIDFDITSVSGRMDFDHFGDWFEQFFEQHMEPLLLGEVVEGFPNGSPQLTGLLPSVTPVLEERLRPHSNLPLAITELKTIKNKEVSKTNDDINPVVIGHLVEALHAMGCAVVVMSPKELNGEDPDAVERRLKRGL